jgi:hypothetical protein
MQMSDSAEKNTAHPSRLSREELLAACETQRTRRGGPGGQHRNKTETAIVVTHRETGVSGQAGERRSQKDNLSAALFRLRLNLAVAIRTEKQIESESSFPIELWRKRASSGKLNVSPKHADFPPLVAEALDWIFAFEFDLAEAARKKLGVSTSQLVKFMKLCPDAWQLVQAKRHEFGLPRLK